MRLRLAEAPACLLNLCCTAPEFDSGEDVEKDLTRAGAALRFSRYRIQVLAIAAGIDLWEDRWPRIPRTKGELTEQMEIRYEADELTAIKM